MAETITYDPANDPVAIAEAEARDNETLEQGEKLITEQQNLLAGKYKNAEELEKAYLELQKKQGETSTEEAQPETTTEEPPQYYTEDGSVNYDTAKEVYGEKLSDIFQNSEIDPFAMNEHFAKNEGSLTEEMYQQLETAGLTRGLVDSYLEGVRQKTGIQPQAEAATLSDAEIAEVHGIAGGKDGYEQLMTWASDNMSDADAKSFDEVIETGNKAAVTFAVKALMGQYEDAVGRDSNLVQGKASDNTGDVYRSMAEVVRDMNNPEYDRDPAVRADVQRKLERSNLQV